MIYSNINKINTKHIHNSILQANLNTRCGTKLFNYYLNILNDIGIKTDSMSVHMSYTDCTNILSKYQSNLSIMKYLYDKCKNKQQENRLLMVDYNKRINELNEKINNLNYLYENHSILKTNNNCETYNYKVYLKITKQDVFNKKIESQISKTYDEINKLQEKNNVLKSTLSNFYTYHKKNNCNTASSLEQQIKFLQNINNVNLKSIDTKISQKSTNRFTV